MRKNRTILFTFVAASALLTSCQKVIELDLNSSAPQIVIQGNVYDQPGPYEVKISKTINFDEPNIFPQVTGATVTISDNTGYSEDLSESIDGTYVTSSLQGVPGRTYTLTVKADGKTYTASSTMPTPVNIDNLYMKKAIFGDVELLTIDFLNPANTENYYRVIQFVNGEQKTGFNIISVNTSEPKLTSYSFMSLNASTDLVSDDEITVWLECIDKRVYEYFRTAGSDGGQSASPSNPTSNISNGALGYFDACSIRSKAIIIQ